MSDATTVPHRVSGVPVRTLRVDVTGGPDSGKSCVAQADVITIGTADNNDLVLTDETVSRYHVELIRKADRIVVQDHGSTNGTSIGTAQIERGTIAPGTVLRIGRTSIRVDDGEVVTVELYENDRFGRLRGRSSQMRELMARVQRASESDVSVLVLGETGVGKEIIAHSLHEASARREKPFETVDCASLQQNLIASELFGHERGAFTGAERQHIGAFERANGGTIFLDEIGELPANLQSALLGVLERRSFRRLGSQKTISVDVRVVCATNRDLRSEVNAGRFRQDLYFRIAVFLVRVPPLREHPSDIPLLAEHFLREAGHPGEIGEIISAETMEQLKSHTWPGNVRELRNVVEMALAAGETRIDVGDGDVSSASATNSPWPDLEEIYARPYKTARAVILERFEGSYLKQLIDRTGGNVSRAAREAKIHRSYLIEMLKRHPIKKPE